MLAATLDRIDDAHRWFEQAVDAHEAAGAPLFVAETRLDWARVCIGVGEVDRARELIGQALTAAAKGGAPGIEEQARTLLNAAFGGIGRRRRVADAAPADAADFEAGATRVYSADEISAALAAAIAGAGARGRAPGDPERDGRRRPSRADADLSGATRVLLG